MHSSILVDTNVWLDYYIPQRTQHESAVRMLNGCAAAGYTPLIASSCLSDLFYNLQAATKAALRSENGLTREQAVFANEYAWGCMEDALSFATVVGADAADAWRAQRHRRVHDDFGDDLVIAAALRAKPDYLVTNDKRLLQHCPYAAIDVKDAIELLEL